MACLESMTAKDANKKFALIYLYLIGGSVFLGAIALAFAFYFIDPLQFFHPSSQLPKNLLSSNMREQAIGILRNYPHDSLILGSSMLENTSAEEASRLLKGNFINISLRGSDFSERRYLLDSAFKQDIKNVIFSLDHFFLHCTENSKQGEQKWISLYGNNPLRFFKYYFTRENILNLFKVDKGLQIVNPDMPGAWLTQPEFAQAFGGMANWAALMQEPHLRITVKEEILDLPPAQSNLPKKKSAPGRTEVFAYLDKYLLEYVKKHPETNFHLVFPPYYRLVYAKWLRYEPDRFQIYLDSIRYLVENSRKYPNLYVYGFEDHDFVDSIENYADPYHYHPRINSMMLEAIRNASKLNEKNMDAYLGFIAEKAADYDFDGFVSKMRESLRQNEIGK